MARGDPGSLGKAEGGSTTLRDFTRKLTSSAAVQTHMFGGEALSSDGWRLLKIVHVF